MAALTTALLGALAVASAGSSIAQNVAAAKANKKAQKEQDAALAKADAGAAALQTQTDLTKKRAQQAAELARNRAIGAVGRGDTILTGPSGLTTAPLTGGKTLLGM